MKPPVMFAGAQAHGQTLSIKLKEKPRRWRSTISYKQGSFRLVLHTWHLPTSAPYATDPELCTRRQASKAERPRAAQRLSPTACSAAIMSFALYMAAGQRLEPWRRTCQNPSTSRPNFQTLQARISSVGSREKGAPLASQISALFQLVWTTTEIQRQLSLASCGCALSITSPGTGVAKAQGPRLLPECLWQRPLTLRQHVRHTRISEALTSPRPSTPGRKLHCFCGDSQLAKPEDDRLLWVLVFQHRSPRQLQEWHCELDGAEALHVPDVLFMGTKWTTRRGAATQRSAQGPRVVGLQTCDSPVGASSVLHASFRHPA